MNEEAKTLSEDQIRKIVRDELDKAALGADGDTPKRWLIALGFALQACRQAEDIIGSNLLGIGGPRTVFTYSDFVNLLLGLVSDLHQ